MALALRELMPDANSMQLLRGRITGIVTSQVLFDAPDHGLRANGYLKI